MNIKRKLNSYKRDKKAIGNFDMVNFETFQAITNASKIAKSPCFVGTSPRTIKYIGFDNIIDLTKKRKNYFLNLDKGNYSYVKKCIKAGYDSVMFEAKNLSLKENISKTKRLVKSAHNNDCLIEGSINSLDNLTDINDAKLFCEKTEIDIFSIEIGNKGGYYKYLPVIDFEKLKLLDLNLHIPLSLHGASGLKDETILNCIYNGVTKINMSTELMFQFSNFVYNNFKRYSINRLNKDSFDLRNYLGKARSNLSNFVTEKIRLFAQL